jgi:hypothetical protein
MRERLKTKIVGRTLKRSAAPPGSDGIGGTWLQSRLAYFDRSIILDPQAAQTASRASTVSAQQRRRRQWHSECSEIRA